MTIEDIEYKEPAKGDKAEAIRRKYCLENNRVYEDLDFDWMFAEKEDNAGDTYLCFKASELDTINHNGKLYFIKRIKN